MPHTARFESFEKGLRRLLAKFQRGISEFKNPGYLEAQLRDHFLFRTDCKSRFDGETKNTEPKGCGIPSLRIKLMTLI